MPFDGYCHFPSPPRRGKGRGPRLRIQSPIFFHVFCVLRGPPQQINDTTRSIPSSACLVGYGAAGGMAILDDDRPSNPPYACCPASLAGLGPQPRKCGQRPALVRCTRCWPAFDYASAFALVLAIEKLPIFVRQYYAITFRIFYYKSLFSQSITTLFIRTGHLLRRFWINDFLRT